MLPWDILFSQINLTKCVWRHTFVTVCETYKYLKPLNQYISCYPGLINEFKRLCYNCANIIYVFSPQSFSDIKLCLLLDDNGIVSVFLSISTTLHFLACVGFAVALNWFNWEKGKALGNKACMGKCLIKVVHQWLWKMTHHWRPLAHEHSLFSNVNNIQSMISEDQKNMTIIFVDL